MAFIMTQPDAPNQKSESRPGPFSFFRRSLAWLFSQKHFYIKLLSGTVAGVIVIIFLAGTFLFVTYRNHNQEALRSHTIAILRLSNVIENDIAALEASHRGFLLTSNPAYRGAFDQRRTAIKERIDALTDLILESSAQRKRVMKVQEIVNSWLAGVAIPEMDARQRLGSGAAVVAQSASTNGGTVLGDSALDQARELVRALQNEEQIVLNQRMRDQEWAAQSTQILDLLPKLERSVVEMEKEKRGYLLTGQNEFVEGYALATAAFANYQGYLSILVAKRPSRPRSSPRCAPTSIAGSRPTPRPRWRRNAPDVTSPPLPFRSTVKR
jgi:CHASE3 domain sensor protein